MTIDKITKYIDSWAPKGIAWEKDNVGLQVGSLKQAVNNILLSLDVNDYVVEDAIKKKCNLIICHHPLLFNPIRKITSDDKTSELIIKLIKNDITVYSAHTNLDFTKDGVSVQLAKKLGLNSIKFLKNISETLTKLVVFVPAGFTEKVAEAIHNNGGGIIGEYTNCSFRVIGKGTFRGSEKSNPTVGKKGKLELVDEVRLEVLVNTFDLPNVISAMKEAHPYEEVAYDIYPLKNENVNYGIGAIGNLGTDLTQSQFLDYVSKKLGIKNFRFSQSRNKKIKTVAVCGGSGSDLLNTAIQANADAFITADIKYHTFQDAENRILLIDAGHYETEIFILDEIERRLKNFITESKIGIFKFKGTTNPIRFYNN
ncbi:MAG: Nif3-like dinuclear metal center hexameric protein [Ignavibacterium sp.]